MAALRTGFAALGLWLLVRPWRGEPVPRARLGWLAAYGLTMGLMNLTVYWAIARIPLGLAVAIEIAGPLLLVLSLSRRKTDFLWLALAVAGLSLLVPWPGAAERLDPLGLAFAVAAGTCWAGYIVLGKRVSGLGGARSVAIGVVFACLVTLPFGIGHAGSALLDPQVLAWGAGVALLSSMVPYVLEMKALAHLSAKTFGLITSSAPAVAALAGFVVLGERLTGTQWLAVALMIGASAGCALTARSPVPPAPDAPLL
ncbi:EamA family transporter [Alteraurantiacibacter buctensis]|uniref:EamA family transporter n=1 Tax=Alteraurantiacibacter buctensis TaxID=1503981 RepID=UPI001EEE070F|nr:EamA family transporter [Alteraurantiacibacter buctensis]